MSVENITTLVPWQQQLQQVITSTDDLLNKVGLSAKDLPVIIDNTFPLRVPYDFVKRMQVGNPLDPLLLQVLPAQQELMQLPGFSDDPVKEQTANPVPGLLHKYHGRVLLTLTSSCAIHCRYCFRRHFPYEQNNPGKKGWAQALDYIAKQPSITEVILSGGDPLVVNDRTLAFMIQQLEHIDHVQRLRIHTRLPIVIPARITDCFIQVLTETRLKPIIVLHSNHAQEMSPDVKMACAKINKAAIPLFNQAVLLRHINDSANSLIALSEALFSANVLPYYLHLLDKVNGSAHFLVDESKAKQLHQQIQEKLPGYLVPKLVTEQPGIGHKVLL